MHSRPPTENGPKTTCRLNLLDTCLISSIGFDQVASSPIRASPFRPQAIVIEQLRRPRCCCHFPKSSAQDVQSRLQPPTRRWDLASRRIEWLERTMRSLSNQLDN